MSALARAALQSALERELAAHLEERTHQPAGGAIANEVRLQRLDFINQRERTQPRLEPGHVQSNADREFPHAGKAVEIGRG